MQLYLKISNEICSFLVEDLEAERVINENGVFTLARELKKPSIQTARFRGYLLALCKNNLQDYDAICNAIYDTIVKEGKYGKSRMLKEDAILKLANSLKPLLPSSKKHTHSKTTGITALIHIHSAIKNSGHIPELADALFSKPGIEYKYQSI